jgi:ubiquinone biosynthesis protein Coq4
MKYKNTKEGRRAVFMRYLVAFSQPFYRQFSRKNSVKWTVKTAQLADYPAHSLGYVLSHFLQKHRFHLMAEFESHDVFHVLLGYTPTVLDEARMQYCLLGSGRYSFYAIGTCLIAFIIYPEQCLHFFRHYQRGKRLQHFSYWDFESLLAIDIEQLKAKILRPVLVCQ